MIVSLGCDIVEIARIERKLEKLTSKVLSTDELKLYQNFSSKKRKIEFVAGRFAAKEAIIKAYPTAIKMTDINISYQNDKPLCNLKNIKVTISHENNYAIAFAILTE